MGRGGGVKKQMGDGVKKKRGESEKKRGDDGEKEEARGATRNEKRNVNAVKCIKALVFAAFSLHLSAENFNEEEVSLLTLSYVSAYPYSD